MKSTSSYPLANGDEVGAPRRPMTFRVGLRSPHGAAFTRGLGAVPGFATSITKAPAASPLMRAKLRALASPAWTEPRDACQLEDAIGHGDGSAAATGSTSDGRRNQAAEPTRLNFFDNLNWHWSVVNGRRSRWLETCRRRRSRRH